MKRHFLYIIAFLLILALFSGCTDKKLGQSEKISIVCTIFPQYDWVRQIIGEENMHDYELTLLIDNRVDLHSYSPTVQDIAKIATCDVFIYNGGDSDDWVDAVLAQAVNKNMVAVSLMDILDGMMLIDDIDHDAEECEEDHDHEHDESHADEHIWLSLHNASVACYTIANILSYAYPDNEGIYKSNSHAYVSKLTALDIEYQRTVDAADKSTLVFADRFPFRYMTEEYGLTYYTAFHGCSAETEASFATIISLANRINQLDLQALMVTESSDQSIAKTIIDNTESKNQKILVLDAMQSVTQSEIKDGVTYLSIMENNLAVLKEALG